MLDILEETKYCLQCKVKPCSIKGCPLGNNIPEFIRLAKEEKYEEAYEVISTTSVLPGICGQICPHENQCQGSCVRGMRGKPVNIGEIEHFIFKQVVKSGTQLKQSTNLNTTKYVNKKVAVIGSGPAGLTAAAFLAREGIKVTIFEKYNYLGGILMHGIPKFRLSKNIVDETIKRILNLGVEVQYGKELGKNLNLDELDFDAVFLAIGANVSSMMNIEGENIEGVYGGNELLEYNLHPDYTGKTVIVNGGGNVAIDCARTVKRLGAKNVFVTYRRSEVEMKADKKEVEDARQEGIEFMFLNNIVRILKENEKLSKVELIKTELIEKEGNKRLVPINIEGSNFVIEADYVIMALGSKTDEIVKSLGVELNEFGCIKINENYETSRKNIFAGRRFSRK